MSSEQREQHIIINNGKQNRIMLTVILTVSMTVLGWVINSETVMPNLMGFYLRVRYGRELAEIMKPKTPEQIRLEALEGKIEEERQARDRAEQNRVEQQRVIDQMAKDSAAKKEAELRLVREREAEQRAELERIREVGRLREAAERKAAEEERYRQSEEGKEAARKADEQERIRAAEVKIPALATLREKLAECDRLRKAREPLEQQLRDATQAKLRLQWGNPSYETNKYIREGITKHHGTLIAQMSRIQEAVTRSLQRSDTLHAEIQQLKKTIEEEEYRIMIEKLDATSK